VLDEAKKRGIPVIEDAAQAIGAKLGSRNAGNMGLFGCFSFFPSKNLGGFGDGGLVTTNDDALAEKARLLRTHGSKPKYYHSMVGANFRIDALFSALLRPKVKRLDGWTKRRQENAALYTKLLVQSGVAETQPSICKGQAKAGTKSFATSKKLLLPCECQSRHIYNQYTLRVPGEGARDRLMKALEKAKVGAEIYYPVPMHLQQCFTSLGHKAGDFPASEAACKETLALPIFPELTEAEVRYVVERIVDAVK
jgi:dTDP-4-amino-4,6-dideoxygalactose transaminase